MPKRSLLPLAVVVAVAATAAVAVATRTSDGASKQHSSPSAGLGATLVPAPREGERWIDVSDGGRSEQDTFLDEARRRFNVPTNAALTPLELVQICVGNGTAQVAHRARVDKEYARRHAEIERDVDVINRNCHDKYGDRPYIEPKAPDAHTGHGADVGG